MSKIPTQTIAPSYTSSISILPCSKYADVDLSHKLRNSGKLSPSEMLVVLQGKDGTSEYKSYAQNIDGIENSKTLKLPESTRESFEKILDESFMQWVEGLTSDIIRFRIMNVLHADIGTGLDGSGLASQIYKYSMRVLGLASGYDFVLVPETEVDFVKNELIPAFRKLHPAGTRALVSPDRVFGFNFDSNNLDLKVTHANEDVMAEIQKVIDEMKGHDDSQGILSPFLIHKGLKPLMEGLNLKLPIGEGGEETLDSLWEGRQAVEDKVDFLESASKWGMNIPTGSSLRNLESDFEKTALLLTAEHKKLFPDANTEVVVKESFSASGMGMFRFANRADLLAGNPIGKDEADCADQAAQFKRMVLANNKLRLERWQPNVVAIPGVALFVRKDESGKPVIRVLANSDMIITQGKIYEGSKGNSQYFTQELLDQTIAAARYAAEHGYEGPLSVDLIVNKDPLTGALKSWVNEVNCRQTGQFTINSLAYHTNSLCNKVINEPEVGKPKLDQEWQVSGVALPVEFTGNSAEIINICQTLQEETGATILPTNYFRGFENEKGDTYDKVQMHFVQDQEGIFSLDKLAYILKERINQRVWEIRSAVAEKQTPPRKNRPVRVSARS